MTIAPCRPRWTPAVPSMFMKTSLFKDSSAFLCRSSLSMDALLLSRLMERANVELWSISTALLEWACFIEMTLITRNHLKIYKKANFFVPHFARSDIECNFTKSLNKWGWKRRCPHNSHIHSPVRLQPIELQIDHLEMHMVSDCERNALP